MIQHDDCVRLCSVHMSEMADKISREKLPVRMYVTCEVCDTQGHNYHNLQCSVGDSHSRLNLPDVARISKERREAKWYAIRTGGVLKGMTDAAFAQLKREVEEMSQYPRPTHFGPQWYSNQRNNYGGNSQNRGPYSNNNYGGRGPFSNNYRGPPQYGQRPPNFPDDSAPQPGPPSFPKPVTPPPPTSNSIASPPTIAPQLVIAQQ